MKVQAINRGYYGGEIRDPGDVFEFPDEDWKDKSLRPSWVERIGKREADAIEAAEDPDEHSPVGDNPANIPKAADGKTPAARARGRKPKADKGAKAEPHEGDTVAGELGTDPDWLPPQADSADDGE